MVRQYPTGYLAVSSRGFQTRVQFFSSDLGLFLVDRAAAHGSAAVNPRCKSGYQGKKWQILASQNYSYTAAGAEFRRGLAMA